MSRQTRPQPAEAPFPAAHPEPISREVARPWLTVMLRELGVKARDRSLLISTVITVVLIVGGILVSGLLSERTTTYDLAVVGEGSAAAAAATEASLGEGDETEVREVTRGEAETLLADGDADAALIREGDGWTLLADSEIDTALQRAVAEAVSATTIETNAAAAGTSMAELSQGSEVRVEYLAGDADRGLASYLLRFVFALLFYMAAIIFGMAIASSVLEEKQNRVVEILATAIPVRQILYGKVLGNCLVAFMQIGLYAGAGLITASAVGLTGQFGWALAASGWFIAFFVLGFAAQATIWAALGALASRTEDLNSNTGPIMTVLVVAMFAGLAAQGPWLAVASYVPIMSSIAMPARLIEGEAATWEPFASLLLCVLFGWFMLRIADRVYQRAVFQGGRALTWRQALKLED